MDPLSTILEGIKNNHAPESVKTTQADLLALRESFMTHHDFTPGQLVQWKPFMDISTRPGPFVVMEVLSEPERDTAEDTGSPLFCEQLDLRCGDILIDGTFVQRLIDSRRLEPFNGSDL
ncbi:MAG: hypothetical protein V3573_14620 [Desulfovibrionaceae bacterium]